MRCTLSRTDIGLLAQPESVLALAPPPCGALALASPPFGLAGARAAPPFVFLSFSFPFFLPEVTLCSKEFGLREGRQWATILAQALAELNLTQVGLGSVRSLKRQPTTQPCGCDSANLKLLIY